MTALTPEALPRLANTLPVPTYDRTRIVPGIVHIGVGGFHRSHQAMYVDRLLSDGDGGDYGICGVGLLPGDRRMKEVLEAQSCLYTLLVKHPDGARAALGRDGADVGSHDDRDPDPLVHTEELIEQHGAGQACQHGVHAHEDPEQPLGDVAQYSQIGRVRDDGGQQPRRHGVQQRHAAESVLVREQDDHGQVRDGGQPCGDGRRLQSG